MLSHLKFAQLEKWKHHVIPESVLNAGPSLAIADYEPRRKTAPLEGDFTCRVRRAPGHEMLEWRVEWRVDDQVLKNGRDFYTWSSNRETDVDGGEVYESFMRVRSGRVYICDRFADLTCTARFVDDQALPLRRAERRWYITRSPNETTSQCHPKLLPRVRTLVEILGIMIGVVLGVVLGLLFICCAVRCIMRRRERAELARIDAEVASFGSSYTTVGAVTPNVIELPSIEYKYVPKPDWYENPFIP